jgi:hypothetical protein
MASRIENLTEIGKPIAQNMADRYKNVLSADVLLFSELNPEEREVYMAEAAGWDIGNSEDFLKKKICTILDELGVKTINERSFVHSKCSHSA